MSSAVAGSNETVCTVPVIEEDMVIPILKKIHYLMCMGVWPACVSVYRVDAEAEESSRASGTGHSRQSDSEVLIRQGCAGGGVLTEVQ